MPFKDALSWTLSNIYDGLFFAKIVKGLKMLTTFSKTFMLDN